MQKDPKTVPQSLHSPVPQNSPRCFSLPLAASRHLSPGMSQSLKCDEHRRWLHNAKSLLLQLLQLQLIGDGVKRVYKLACTCTHSLARSHTRTPYAFACDGEGGCEKRKKKKKRAPLPLSWHIHPKAEEPPPLLVTRLSFQAQDPRCYHTHTVRFTHARTHTHTHSILSLVSLSHTRTDAAALTQPVREEGSKGVRKGGGGSGGE